MRKILIRGVLLILSCVVCLGITEFVLRKFYVRNFIIPPWQTSPRFVLDQELVYTFVPQKTTSWKTKEFTEISSINKYGIRGSPDLKEQKPDDSYRILLSGDSFTFGHGLTDEQTIPSVLETIMNNSAPGHRTEVLNSGVQGYSPDQIYRLLLRDIPRFNPDVVVVDYVPFNIENMISREGQFYRASLYDISSDEKLIPLDARLNRQYILLSLFSKTPLWIRNSYMFDYVATSIYNLPFLSGIPELPKSKLYAWAERKLFLEITSVRDLCRIRHCKLFVAWLPSWESVRHELPKEDTRLIRTLTSQMKNENIHVIDLVDSLQRQTEDSTSYDYNASSVLGTSDVNPETFFFPADHHPNATGAAVFAEELSGYILKAGSE